MNISKYKRINPLLIIVLLLFIVANKGISAQHKSEISKKIKPVLKINQSFEERIDYKSHGFFVSPDGFFVTTYKAIEGYREAFIKLSNNYKQKFVVYAKDKLKGYAILKPIENKHQFEYFELADSTDLTVGEPIFVPLNKNELKKGKISGKPANIGSYYNSALTLSIPFRELYIGKPVLDSFYRVVGLYTIVKNQPVILPINFIKPPIKKVIEKLGEKENALEVDIEKRNTDSPYSERVEMISFSSDVKDRQKIKSSPYTRALFSINNLNIVPDSVIEIGGNSLHSFGTVSACAFDSKSNLYVLSKDFNAIYKYSKDGAFIKRNSSDGKSLLSNPVDIFIDNESSTAEVIYVLDKGHDRIAIYNTDLNYITEWKYSDIYDHPLFSPKFIRVYEDDIYIGTEKNNLFHLAKDFKPGKKSFTSKMKSNVWNDYSEDLKKISSDYHEEKYYKASSLIKIGTDGYKIGEYKKLNDLIKIDKRLYVLDSGNKRIQITNLQGKVVGKIKLSRKCSKVLTFGKKYLYVLYEDNKKIERYTLKGKKLKSFNYPKNGMKHGNLKLVNISPEHKIFLIYDEKSHIELCSETGKKLDSFQSFGKTKNSFYNVRSIAVDNQGNLYSVDEKPAVQKFPFVSDVKKPGDVKYDPKYKSRLENLIFPKTQNQKHNLKGITVTDDRLFVTDVLNNFLYIMELKTNKLIKKIKLGGKGFGEAVKPLQMSSYKDKVYITDYINRRIVIFDENGTFINSFYVKDKYGKLANPLDISVGSEDKIYVLIEKGVLRYNLYGDLLPIIEKSERNPKAIYSLELQDTKDSYLGNNKGLAFYKNILFITDYFNSSVKMYTLFGTNRKLGNTGNLVAEFYRPTDIVVKEISGSIYLYVVDSGNSRIQRFKLSSFN